MVSKKLLKNTMAGAFIAYAFVHPLMMLTNYFMSGMSHSSASMQKVSLWSEIVKSFSIPMLPWSLAFALFGGLSGFFYYRTRQAEEDKSMLIDQLQKSLSKIKTLSGLLPICASCKKIRDDKGYWNQIESYISDHSEAEFSHGICPECAKKLYPDLIKRDGSATDR
jgi:hypothetical protein